MFFLLFCKHAKKSRNVSPSPFSRPVRFRPNLEPQPEALARKFRPAKTIRTCMLVGTSARV